MKHSHKSNHAHVLMSGHNPEHRNKENNSHRGTSNVKHHMRDNHNTSHETSHTKPCDILMRQHHYYGGPTNISSPHFSKGGNAKRRFATGGHVDHESTGGRPRKRHAFGGSTTVGIAAMPKWTPRGGPLYSKTGPSLDFLQKLNANLQNNNAQQGVQDGVSQVNNMKSAFFNGPRQYKKGGHCYAEGGETKEYGEKPLTGQLRKGGRAMRRDHHFDGEPVGDNSVREERKRGGRAKRQHHYWGQNVIGRLPLIGGIANSIANTAGTLDANKYGGAEYAARTKGQKAADILSTIGNLGANIALSKGGAKKSKGGGVHHDYRQHHAAGGSGKIRKGMMTKSGRMIHSKV